MEATNSKACACDARKGSTRPVDALVLPVDDLMSPSN